MKKHSLRSVFLVALFFFTGAWPSALAQPDTFSYGIDPDLEPVLPELPGIGGGAERPVGAVLEPDGVQGDYVVNEVILHGPTGDQLAAFIDTYEAEVIFGDDLPGDPGNLPPDKLRPAFSTTDDYLLRVNLNLADTTEFEYWMEQQGYEGEYVFSSDGAMRVVAIAAKEEQVNDLSMSLNPLMMPPEQPAEASGRMGGAVGRTPFRWRAIPPQKTPFRWRAIGASAGSADCVMCRTEEYAVTNGYANGFTFSWLNDAGLKATRAWQYRDLLELAPTTLQRRHSDGAPSSHPVLAMVDFGFSLNADFPANVPQYDFETDSYTTNGNANTLPSDGKWYGTGAVVLVTAGNNGADGAPSEWRLFRVMVPNTIPATRRDSCASAV